MTSTLRLRCRQIAATDAPAIVRLLAKGFPDRSKAYWAQAITRLLDHAARLPVPACGYLLEGNGAAVGVLLLIYAQPRDDGSSQRCNLSSWYVEPEYQGYASLLVARALKQKDMTFFNISPATHTWATIEAQGFARYSNGRVMAVPALGPLRAVRVHRYDPARHGSRVGDSERDLLLRHAGYGCLPLCVSTPDDTWPFLFLPRRIKGLVPSAQLIYAPSIAAFVDFSGPIGRFLLRWGMPVVSIDADGPIDGLVGHYFTDRIPKYFKGPRAPRIGDMTDTELVMFGP